METNFSKLTNLESIKEFCNSHLFEIVTGSLRMKSHSTKVRFIDPEGNFGVTGLGWFFFYEDCMYILTNNKKFEIYHNPDISDFREDFDILKITDEYIVRVVFAGVFTGLYDDEGNRVFTGDVVKANILLNPSIQSTGGTTRAKNLDSVNEGSLIEAGVNEMFGIYSIILDNHSVPLSWVLKIEVIGSLFYNLEQGETEVDLQSLCNCFAQSRTDKQELMTLIKKSPYYTPVTRQKKKKNFNKYIIGLTGEYFVAGMLGLQGYICNLTLKNYPSVDIFVYDSQKEQTINLQVKTTIGTSYQVGLYRSQRDNIDDNITCPFVFVHIDKSKNLNYYILSKNQLIDLILRTDDDYYNRGRENTLKDYPIAISLKNLVEYKNQWGNLWL